MAAINRKKKSVYTHEGAKAKHISPELQLRRSVMSCLLWEKTFYEDGVDIAKRISSIVPYVPPQVVANIAIEARNKMNLRHVPLLLVVAMLKSPEHKKLVDDVIYQVINRPDELSELVAIYFDGKKKPLAAKLKKGLAKAFTKFDAYRLAKWNKKKEINLRDVMFLVHPKPIDKEQEITFKQLANNSLPTPDTWEVALSSGGDKKAHWERLLKENKLGALALLRNLRNMVSVDVKKGLIVNAIHKSNTKKVLPYRFIAAAKYAPDFEPELEVAMLRSLQEAPKMKGRTVLLVDVSGSMDWKLSAKSDLNRLDAACGLAILLREICEDIAIYTFSTKLVKIPPRRGFALRDAIFTSQSHDGTYLGRSIRALYEKKGKKIIVNDRFYGRFYGNIEFHGQGESPDRLIVITDEQSADSVPDPKGKGYMINVVSYEHGVGYGKWIHVDGFSEAVVKWIQSMENENLI